MSSAVLAAMAGAGGGPGVQDMRWHHSTRLCIVPSALPPALGHEGDEQGVTWRPTAVIRWSQDVYEML